MSSAALEAQLRTPRRNNKATFFWRFRQNKLAVMGLGIVVVLIFVAVFATFIAPTGYTEAVLSESRQFPSWSHWFGTDQIGRDYLSRSLFGIRTSIMVGFGVQLITLSVGFTLGALGGYLGG